MENIIKKTNLDFISFLKTIDLETGRNNFSKNKSVEEDLPHEIQILSDIYEIYWIEKKFINFNQFISLVISEKELLLKEYNLKRNGNSPYAESAYLAFKDGWVARQYRTWTSILTQIQLAYLFEENYPQNKVLMSEELDRSGVDIRVIGINDYGVKKLSSRQDMQKIKRLEKNGVIPITYEVPSQDILKNPKTKKGDYRKPYLKFKEDTRLDILDNGFIIFNKNIFNELLTK
jgi:hypothetical protein